MCMNARCLRSVESMQVSAHHLEVKGARVDDDDSMLGREPTRHVKRRTDDSAGKRVAGWSSKTEQRSISGSGM